VVFQPHRYSRTYYLIDDFVDLFKSLDKVLLLDIYGASEENTFGISSLDMINKVSKEECIYIPSKEELFDRLDELKDSVIVFMGAGSIGQWSHEYAKT